MYNDGLTVKIQESSHVAEKEAKKKVKRPTALKRDITSQKKYLQNKAFKSRIRTAVRTYKEALVQENAEVKANALNEVYSLVDKATKKGLYKKNKSSRIKSRLASKLAA
ncbi:MAG: 30S ribosomal protein S20 [Chlamydiia bacterium]|nr:30S ribosomal protein S20 [Chlamydiia bacterium]